ncbi:MarR family winged helix-turn-helix transcriptional regulator [Krasilnikovia sp. M28-CT-15]|uniref:MarR family winged helix-turn-helix transcriptional regulator n=1 Tax=Krasilnikovia sp. M28-CT-15 TaxID=3373540 RepID=UPI003876A3A0
MPAQDRADLGAMVMHLGRRILAMERPILARHDISMWGYVVLSALRDQPMRTQVALATSIGADKTRLIAVLDELQRRALIRREPDPADRRARLLGLTPAGRRLHQRIRADIRAAEQDLLAALAEADRTTFLAALAILDDPPPGQPE